jgi:uncharacterized protein YecE (DUF72 family)
MFYSVPPSEVTPKPFAELRVFFFTDKKLTREDLIIAKKSMATILKRLMIVFHTLPYAIELKRADYEEKQELDLIRGKLITEIHGFEVEEIDIDEVSQWFKERKKRLLLNEMYRYARFYRKDGTIKREYDEWDIRKLEERIKEIIGE